jgi:hypothetical protein
MTNFLHDNGFSVEVELNAPHCIESRVNCAKICLPSYFYPVLLRFLLFCGGTPLRWKACIKEIAMSGNKSPLIMKNIRARMPESRGVGCLSHDVARTFAAQANPASRYAAAAQNGTLASFI